MSLAYGDCPPLDAIGKDANYIQCDVSGFIQLVIFPHSDRLTVATAAFSIRLLSSGSRDRLHRDYRYQAGEFHLSLSEAESLVVVFLRLIMRPNS